MRLSFISLRLSPAPDHTFMKYYLVELLKTIVVLTLSSGDAVLFNAEQSSTYCNSVRCYNASRAIDGDWSTYSRTDYVTGTHWWQVSMTNMTVYQIELKAVSYYSEDITVSLYSGETLSGECQSHIGYGRETQSCARVAADRVRLSTSSTKVTGLYVYEIRVTEALIETIGL